jgi:hypothetical protein
LSDNRQQPANSGDAVRSAAQNTIRNSIAPVCAARNVTSVMNVKDSERKMGLNRSARAANTAIATGAPASRKSRWSAKAASRAAMSVEKRSVV